MSVTKEIPKIPREDTDLVKLLRKMIGKSEQIDAGSLPYITDRRMNRYLAGLKQYLALPANHWIAMEFPADKIIPHYRSIEEYYDRKILSRKVRI